MKMILTLSLISIVILACGDDNDSLVIPEPVNPQNSAPVINTIFVPEQVHAGARITLGVSTEDPDGDTLTYNWQVAGGLLSSNSTPKVIWTTPTEMGFTTVTLSVKDPTNKVVTKSAEVRVIHSLIVPGQEAAGIRMGAPLSSATKLYGTPKHNIFINDLPGEDGKVFWENYEWKNVGLIVHVDSSGHIDGIKITEPNTAKTVGCNGIDSPYDKVRDEFGRPPYEAGGTAGPTGRTIYESYPADISFEYPVSPDANHKSLTHIERRAQGLGGDVGRVVRITIGSVLYD